MNPLEALTPRLPRRHLLIIAAVVWTFAGGMLLYRGILLFMGSGHLLWIRLTISVAGGLLFYRFLFSEISRKHTRRILDLPLERPCLFSFFSIRSYILMGIMITAGITLRKSGIIQREYLSVICVTMGIPLFASAFKFYYAGVYYRDEGKETRMSNEKMNI